MTNTRKNIECEVHQQNLSATFFRLTAMYLCHRQIVKDDNNGKDPSVSEVSKKVISALKNIWENASLQVCKDFDSCKCKIKVLKTEQEFFKDQRRERRMFIGNVDVKLTKVLEKRMRRKIKSVKQLGDQSDPEKSELIGKGTVQDATSSQVEENMSLSESSSTSEIDF
ncbi:unnamed protein product [Psylliodes chrysocephalus]|uniref:Uncharacterized protein n=1 Tax=Psylliodes chrysocephalus TaxID=3402493 RepID=A0A9P0CHQ1_9CUCU|nr:unnamed protein product [Psylliodes chrysocephala]